MLLIYLNCFKPDIVFIWGMWNLSRQIAFWAEQWMPGRVAYSLAGYWPMQPDVHEIYWQKKANHWWSKAILSPARGLALKEVANEREAYPLALQQVACVSQMGCKCILSLMLSRCMQILH